MSCIDLICQKSVSLSKDSYCTKSGKNLLKLGSSYQMYLFFNLPCPYKCLKNLKQAKLILYKIPSHSDTENNLTGYSSKYNAYPLLDYFSNCICSFPLPNYDHSKKITFEDNARSSYTEVDITEIAQTWINEEIENKGLLLAEKNDSKLITYDSDSYFPKGMRPVLRLSYKDSNLCLPLTATTASVEILADS